jgi:DNA polymerase
MLEDIKQAIHDCTGCILHKRGGSVPFEGPGTAKIALIGQNPGDEELKDQRPFVGRCGTYLDIALQTAGISRSDLFITNTIKCYIKPGKNTTVVQVSKCKHFVFEELAQVKPKVIVAMGTVAGSLFQSRVLTNTHYYDDALGAWVVFTHHPSRILRTHSVEFDIEFKNSLALAKKLTEDSKETLEKPVVNKITTLEALNQAKVHIMALPEFAFDVGTTGLNFCKDKLVSIGISTDKVCYGIEFKKEMVPALKEIFENQAKKIAQNLKFDWKFLKKEGIEISNITFDTMLAHFIIDPLASSHALEAISLKLFHTSFNKKDINYEEIQSRGITQADVDLYVEREALD